MRPSRVSFSPNWNFRYLLIIEDHQIVWGMGVESISSTEKMVASPISFVVLWNVVQILYEGGSTC